MKYILKSNLPNVWSKFEIKNFRTFFRTFPHSALFRFAFESLKEKIKNAENLLLSSVSAVYPGRESNPHACLEHRILSPACLPIPPPGQKKS